MLKIKRMKKMSGSKKKKKMSKKKKKMSGSKKRKKMSKKRMSKGDGVIDLQDALWRARRAEENRRVAQNAINEQARERIIAQEQARRTNEARNIEDIRIANEARLRALAADPRVRSETDARNTRQAQAIMESQARATADAQARERSAAITLATRRAQRLRENEREQQELRRRIAIITENIRTIEAEEKARALADSRAR
jgi:hypothetical protein